MEWNDWLIEAYFWKFGYDIISYNHSNFIKDSIFMKIFNGNDYAWSVNTFLE